MRILLSVPVVAPVVAVLGLARAAPARSAPPPPGPPASAAPPSILLPGGGLRPTARGRPAGTPPATPSTPRARA